MDLKKALLETKRIRHLCKKGNNTITLSNNVDPLWTDLAKKLRQNIPGLPTKLLSLFTETMIRQCLPIIEAWLNDDQEVVFKEEKIIKRK